MQSLDGLLISALIRCYDVRLARARIRANRIFKWKNGVAVFCMIVAIVSLSWIPHKSWVTMQKIVFCSLFMPLVFGWIIGTSILNRAQLPEDGENGHFAARLLGNIADMGAGYATTFLDLLRAVINENASLALLLAEELDACGSQANELTALVREAFG